MGVILLCIVVSFLLWGFTFYHLYLVYQGFTTNESAKSSLNNHYLADEIEYYTEWEEKKRNDPKYVPSEDDVEYYVLDKNMKLKEIQA